MYVILKIYILNNTVIIVNQQKLTEYLHFYSIDTIYLLSIFFQNSYFNKLETFLSFIFICFFDYGWEVQYPQFDPIFTWHRFFECKQVKDQLFPLLLPIHAIFGWEPRLNSNDAPSASAAEFCNISNISPSTIRILSSILNTHLIYRVYAIIFYKGLWPV